jgi:hypothetical protein
MKIRQGTTPSISISLPYGVSHDDIVSAAITIKQSGTIKIERSLPEIDFNEAYGAIKLTQQETLSLNCNERAFIQAAWTTNDDNCYRSQSQEVTIDRADKSEVV